MFRFERLRVWHKAIELYDVVDCAAAGFRGRSRIILGDQIQRATLSIFAWEFAMALGSQLAAR